MVCVPLHECESWTPKTERRIRAFEHKCIRKIISIRYSESTTHCSWTALCPYKCNTFPIFPVVMLFMGQFSLIFWFSIVDSTVTRNMRYFGHFKRYSGFERTVMQGVVHERRDRGRQCGSGHRTLMTSWKHAKMLVPNININKNHRHSIPDKE